ncbi:ABC transporter substrate-binding protein, partial [Bradyrhizobium sp.]|uniref:ABC transporter substrate-binding protein n=1 Tax=Bradyrhizobium sp. TaxID=376 RepID=UPI002BE458CC
CEAPLDIAGELLRAEGFTDVGYVDTAADDLSAAIADRKVDFALDFPVLFAPGIDAGKPVTVLAGVHVGCFELFARNDIRTIANLKDKTIGCEIAPSAFLRLMVAQVGLDPDKDIRWVTDPSVKPLELFAEGKIDAFLGFPPEPQELRARKAGHVILSTVLDRPWSQYFCCMVLGTRDYVRKYPVATKRVLRAILKATDLCATEPARVARILVDGGFTPRYDYALQTLNDVPYNNWREYDAEDTIRFYALRLHEAGLIKASPQKIIADGTDWRFLNELKRELKA